MKIRSLREGITTPLHPPPPLAEPGHGRIVQSHLGINPPNLPARCPQAHTQFRFLASDHVCAVPPYLLEGICPDKHVSPAGFGGPDRGVPLDIAQSVINR